MKQTALAMVIHGCSFFMFMTPVLSCSDSEASEERCGLPIAIAANSAAAMISSTAIWWMGAGEYGKGRLIPTFLVEGGGVALGTAFLYANLRNRMISPLSALAAFVALPPLLGAVGFHGLELRLVRNDSQAEFPTERWEFSAYLRF